MDGISLRRFPWDDLYGQMQRYLVEEEELFAKMVAEAEQTVAKLDSSVKRLRLDKGEYPSSLDDLVVPLADEREGEAIEPLERAEENEHGPGGSELEYQQNQTDQKP